MELTLLCHIPHLAVKCAEIPNRDYISLYGKTVCWFWTKWLLIYIIKIPVSFRSQQWVINIVTCQLGNTSGRRRSEPHRFILGHISRTIGANWLTPISSKMNEKNTESRSAWLAIHAERLLAQTIPREIRTPTLHSRMAAWQSNLEALLKILISVLKLAEASFDIVFVVYGYHF